MGGMQHPELLVSNLFLWKPIHGKTNRGGQSLTYSDQIRQDAGLGSAAEIKA